jgi:hypothetical protein
VLYDSKQESIRDQITTNYTTTATLNRQLNQVNALRTRIQNSPEDPASLYANQLSLVLLLNNIAAGTGGSDSGPIAQLQITLPDTTSAPLSKANQLSEIDAAVKAIQGQQEEISGQTAELEKELLAPSPALTPDQSSSISPAAKAYIARENQLQSQLEQANAQLDNLQKTRDLDRSTYGLLRSRLAEQNVNGVIGDIVAVGSVADEEQTSKARSSVRSWAIDVAIWVVIALIIGIGLAYLLGLTRPGFDSNSAITRRMRMSRGGPKGVPASQSGPQ